GRSGSQALSDVAPAGRSGYRVLVRARSRPRPRGSALYAEVGPIPFGYANEQLDVYDPANPRHEDHCGHKIEGENDVMMRFGSAAAGSLFEIRCDVLAKLHQGTHSKDAFTNNLHELAYHIRCTDGTRLDLTQVVREGVDRKSTRLNSSHRTLSHAVLCYK